jgi:hypothetical protein
MQPARRSSSFATHASTRARSVVLLLLLPTWLAFADAPPQASAEDLLFRDLFAMPVGPRGLQPSAELLQLNGKVARMRGYIAHQESPIAGVFILSPLPVELGDADEGLADDLPPAIVFVHASDRAAPYPAGVVQVTGTLEVGPQNEADGRVSQVRLVLDPDRPDALVGLTPPTAANATAPAGHLH